MAARRTRMRRDEQLSLMGDVAPAAHARHSRTHDAPPRPRGPHFGEQVELFPPVVRVESLDPRTAVGARTRVQGLWRVRVDGGEAHLVFRDRHGTYCEAHGPSCDAVRVLASQEAGER
jgi:hypothetical protein